MVKYESWMMVLMVLPDYSLRYAYSAMMIVFGNLLTARSLVSGQHSAEYLNTSTYIGSSGVLDLRRYFVYMTFVAIFAMVNC